MRYLSTLCLIGLMSAFAAAASGSAIENALQNAKPKLARLLHENILPYWLPGVLDETHGGYQIHLDQSGAPKAGGDKGLVTQARCLWFFSHLINEGYDDAQYRQAARHGFAFLTEHMWDPDQGGFYWQVDAAGDTPTVSDKHLYGQAFALYALSEYCIAFDDAGAKRWADRLFRVIEHNAYDEAHGGYREWFTADWQVPSGDESGPMGGQAPDWKLMNTHLHLLEAFTVYARINNSPYVMERLRELITIQSNTVVRKTLGACTDRYHLDWTPLRGPQHDTVSYGHDIENVWLLMLAIEEAGRSMSPYSDLFETLYAYSLRHGFDEDEGGFYYTGAFHQDSDDRNKDWWVQAEGLVSALAMLRHSGDPKYLRVFQKTLDWIVDHQADWQNGGWHSRIQPDGAIVGSKANLWKSPYHNGRAVIRCLKLIDEWPSTR